MLFVYRYILYTESAGQRTLDVWLCHQMAACSPAGWWPWVVCLPFEEEERMTAINGASYMKTKQAFNIL